MAALKAVIRHRFQNQKTKYVAYLAFLVLTTMLVVYSVMLLLQDISILGKSAEQTMPSYMSTSSSASPLSSNPTDIEIVYPSNERYWKPD
jgi:hypothetical protein